MLAVYFAAVDVVYLITVSFSLYYLLCKGGGGKTNVGWRCNRRGNGGVAVAWRRKARITVAWRKTAAWRTWRRRGERDGVVREKWRRHR